ncbi:MAG: hypothetical protein ACUVRS_07430 [Armatimonadota bacterium]
MYCRTVLSVLLFFVLVALPHDAGALQVIDAFLVADRPFPEFVQYWSDLEPGEWTAAAARERQRLLGGYIHIYVKNDTAQPVTIDDVLLQGVSLRRAIAYSRQRKYKKVTYAASIYFADLSKEEREALINAGEPVWWKVDPSYVKPGESAGVTVRLRRLVSGARVKVSLKIGEQALEVSIDPVSRKSLVKSVGFGEGLNEVYLYFESSDSKTELQRVLLDGQDITPMCTIGSDSRVRVLPVVCKLSSAIVRGSFHCFTGIYDDGSKASAGLRCWDNDLFYGVWGARPGKESDIELARNFIRELAEHNVNAHIVSIASDAVRTFMKSADGQKMMEALGISRVVTDPGSVPRPAAYYLADEPDTADYKVEGVPATSKVGCLGQGLVQRAEELRKIDPETPNMLNVDMTFKPDNWYTYGQLPDIFASDPYFQSHLADVYYRKPYRLPAYTRVTEVYAVASCAQSACAPKPLHIILNGTQVVHEDWKFRFGTPVEKRIEVYYALAAGAKAFSYWWFVPLSARGTGSNGLGADTPEARELWKEIGLLGAEVRTAGPIIVRACPVDIQVEASSRLWIRSLVAGVDTLVLLVVNDDYACDRSGTVIIPVENVKVSVSLPGWLKPSSVFELSCKGTRDLRWNSEDRRIVLDLGTVNVTRFVVVTSDPGLRDRLQELYQSRFASNVARLLEQ